MHPESAGGGAPNGVVQGGARSGTKSTAGSGKGKSNGKGAGQGGGKPAGGRSRRPALTSDHFSLTWRRADGARPVPVAIHRAPRLMMAVAKKLLPRAIDRNTVRRITREAWRAVSSRHPDLDLFVRLQSKPQAWAALPDGQRKRACRVELDGLMARLPGAVR